MMSVRPTVDTPRLHLRAFTLDDAEAYAAVRYHPEVDAWLMPAPTDDPVAQQRAQIEEYEQRWTTHGYAPWAVIERESGRLVGHCGLRWLDSLEIVDTIWTMHPDTQGKGYAREAARAAVDWGFAAAKLPRIGALIRPDNARSQAVARAVGMTIELAGLERRPGQIRDLWVVERAAG
jgi:[ribosomal protein S5]-alanine N-acetyltransferase